MSNNETKHSKPDGEDDHQRVRLLSPTVPKELENWMKDIDIRLQDIPIWKLTIPGSHDSGSYGLDIGLGISPDRPDLQNSYLINIFKCISLPIIHRWTKTQALDITNQLKAGIRYFDLRIASKPDDNYLYFCHGLYGPEVNEMLSELNAFLQQNPSEVVFIDFQKFYSLSDEDHKKLIQTVVDMFGRRLVPYSSQLSMNKFTLRYLWDRRLQVFVYYRNEYHRIQSPLLWPERCIPNPWANTMSRAKLMTFLDENIVNRPLNSMYVTQAILTPSDRYVGFHVCSSLRSDLATECDHCIGNWIESKSAGSKGPNIVMSDFIEWNNYEIPLKTVRLNNKIDFNTKN